MSQSITFSVDLEVELTQWKLGLEIFDLAIVCRENPEIRFESNKQINFSEKRLLTFKEYAPIMIEQLSTYCKNTPHDKIYFLAHNGFPHDYIIILDNLERTGHLNLFKESFGDALFLDSLSFFRAYRNLHKGQFIKIENVKEDEKDEDQQQQQQQQVSLSLTSLCNHFLNLKYYAHTAMSDAESLIKLMDYQPRGAGGFSFLSLNEHKDYSDHCKTFSEVSEIFNAKKKLEKVRHVPGYGAQYKQMEVALSSESVKTDSIHKLLDEGINWFSLVELGKKFRRGKIDDKLKKIIEAKSQRSKIVDWCLKIGKEMKSENDDEEKVPEKSDKDEEEEEEEEESQSEADEKMKEREIRKEENQKEKEKQKTKKFLQQERKNIKKQEEKEILQEEKLIEKERKRTEKFIEAEKRKEENLKEKERLKAERQKEKEKQKEERQKEREIQKEKQKEERQKEREKQKEEKQKERERQKIERQKQKEKLKEIKVRNDKRKEDKEIQKEENGEDKLEKSNELNEQIEEEEEDI